MQRHCTVEIHGGLPAGVRHELERRFGPVEIGNHRTRTMLRGLTLDQAGLRALLELLWDAGVQINAVHTAEGEDHVRH
jgi:hypothetical protein